MEQVLLWNSPNTKEDDRKDDSPNIELFLLDGEGIHPVMIIAPGGGYSHRASHEGYPIAKWLNSIGISAIVLNYRVAPHKHPLPLSDVQRAIRLVRYQSSHWRIDPNRLGIVGFSAGGHLASASGTHFDSGNMEAEDPIERISSRPDVMVLCYPVITMGESTHAGSKQNLLGENPSDDLIHLLSNELHINEQTPPAFLWHTADDASVDVENSFLFAKELRKNSVPFELHVFENGRHGLGLAEDHPEVKVWPRLCEKWLRKRGF
ncbi:alpha/beta hydrolase [Robertmurraya korlensis]|uniref:alpha/beta hydrolase n=1 Tax=Robertmurraya korlensis TaxID=519977 RepID=UPI000826A043|nr:alpha/beta hydrolase [Robertmurraya korlensis]